MSSLLSIFLNPQNGPHAIGGGESSPELLGQVSKEQAKPSGQAFAKAFSQVLREHGDAAAFLQHLQSFVSTRNQPDAVSSLPLLEKGVRHLEGLVGPETVEQILGKLQAYRGEEAPGEFLLPTSVSGSLLDLAKLLSAQALPTPVVLPTESVSRHIQDISIDQASFGRVPTIPVSSLQEFQPSPGTVFQETRFQHTGGDSPLKLVSQEPVIDGKISGNGHIPLPKAFEAGSVLSQSSVPKVAELRTISQEVSQGVSSKQASLSKEAELRAIPQEVSQGSVSNQASSGAKPELSLSIRTIAQSAKDVSSGLQQLERPILENETRQTPILHRFTSPLVRSQHVQTQPIAPAAVIPVEGPAGFTGPNLTNQISVKTIPGNSAVASEVSGSGIEHRTTVPADVLGETGLLAKGDRGQSAADVSGKTVSVDPSGGQGLGSGMNQFSNSQSGFQQSSMSSGQGVGLRGLEERVLEFPAPALQRLQLDVQLSETQRVQIDVGVQNRQVYAGLVMDHSVLRNLANQFVPQLENQLAEVDLELQEFSAEVREGSEQEPHMFDDSRSHEGSMSGRHAQDETLSTRNPVGRQEEHGLHLVA